MMARSLYCDENPAILWKKYAIIIFKFEIMALSLRLLYLLVRKISIFLNYCFEISSRAISNIALGKNPDPAYKSIWWNTWKSWLKTLSYVWLQCLYMFRFRDWWWVMTAFVLAHFSKIFRKMFPISVHRFLPIFKSILPFLENPIPFS